MSKRGGKQQNGAKPKGPKPQQQQQPAMSQDQAVLMARRMLEAQRMANPTGSADYIKREIDNSVKQMRQMETASQQVASTLLADAKRFLASRVKNAKLMNPKLAPYLDAALQTTNDISPSSFENYTLEVEVRNGTVGTLIHSTRKVFVNVVYPSAVYNSTVGKLYMPTEDPIHGAHVDRYARFCRNNKGTSVTLTEFLQEPDVYEQMVNSTYEALTSTGSSASGSAPSSTGTPITKLGLLNPAALIATELPGPKHVDSLSAFASKDTKLNRTVPKLGKELKLWIPQKGVVGEDYATTGANGFYTDGSTVVYMYDGAALLPVTSTDSRSLFLYNTLGAPVTDNSALDAARSAL